MATQVYATVPQRVSTILPFLQKNTEQKIENETEKRNTMSRRKAIGTGIKGFIGVMFSGGVLDLLFACERIDDIVPEIPKDEPIELPEDVKPGETISFAEAKDRARKYVHFGVNQGLQFPYDVIALGDQGIDEAGSDHRTQPTLIGFYAQYLLDIITGNETEGVMDEGKARENLTILLTKLLDVQTNYGWKGLIPTWLNIQGGILSQEDDIYTVGDNLNLAVKLFMIKGALGETDPLWNKAKTFLDRQEEGYAAMVDKGSGRFFGARVGEVSGGRKSAQLSIEKGQSIGYYRMINSHSVTKTVLKSGRVSDIIYDWQLDRITTEFLPGIVWAAAFYGAVPDTVLTSLMVHENEGILSSFNGDTFTYSWPLLTFDLTMMDPWRQVYTKYLAATMKESVRNGQITTSDPAFHPYGGYVIGGRWRTSEGGFIVEGLGSVHGLAAFTESSPLHDGVYTWIENILTVPGLVTRFGLPDGIIGNGTEGNPYQGTLVHTGIAKFAELLGLTNSQGNRYFLDALQDKEGHFIEMYRQLGNTVSAFGSSETLPEPVDVSEAEWKVSDHEYALDKIPVNRDGFQWCRYQRDEEAIELRYFIVSYIKEKGWTLIPPANIPYDRDIDHPNVRGFAEWFTGTDVLLDPVELRKRWMPEEGKTKYALFEEKIATEQWIDHEGSSGDGRTSTGGIGIAALIVQSKNFLKSA